MFSHNVMKLKEEQYLREMLATLHIYCPQLFAVALQCKILGYDDEQRRMLKVFHCFGNSPEDHNRNVCRNVGKY